VWGRGKTRKKGKLAQPCSGKGPFKAMEKGKTLTLISASTHRNPSNLTSGEKEGGGSKEGVVFSATFLTEAPEKSTREER